jgi:3-hydroxyisobutyrate dehydrogenase-like beta-hydroxyacid dehydrogenase
MLFSCLTQMQLPYLIGTEGKRGTACGWHFWVWGSWGAQWRLIWAKAGHEVVVWNRTPGKTTVEGATTAGSPAEAARNREVVWMCLSDTEAVDQVLFGPGGVQESLAPGMVVVDSSTISPFATREFASRVEAKGAEYLDAPVTGSKVAAEGAQLIFIVGGREETLDRVRPLFESMGKAAFHMGEIGKGHAAKLGMNLIIAMTYQGFAEAVTLTSKLGVGLDSLLPLIQASMVRSGVIDYKAPFVLRRDFTPNFPLHLMHKDIRLMLEAARELRVKLPALETVEEIYDVACEEGQGDLDFASVITLLEKWSGTPVKASSG